MKAFQTNVRNDAAPVTRPRYPSILAPVALFLVAGCASLAGPAYERPELPEKASWSELEGRELSASEVIRPDWWTTFSDPYLDGLINEAIAQSIDLRIAEIAVEQAGVELRQQRTELRPEFGASPATSRGRSYDGSSEDAVVEDVDNNEYLGFAGSWEIDLWGKIRQGVKGREANYRMTEMEWRGTYLTLVAGVATKYFRIRQIDEQIENQAMSMEQSQKLLEIYESQFREGLVPETRILSQRAEINRLTSELLERQRTRRQAELELATMLGRPAGDLVVPVAPLRSNVDLIDIPHVLPADMLARRPDVLKAEYELLVAHHAVGSARLRRLPTINLSLAAATGASLVPSFIESWSFVFKGDATGMFSQDVRQGIETSEAARRGAAEAYRKSVLAALEEVEVKLINLYTRQQQIVELEEQVESLRVVRDVRLERLKEGLVSQLELFDTERELLSAQQGVLDSYQQILAETVGLYMALGGGWPAEEPSDRGPRVADVK